RRFPAPGRVPALAHRLAAPRPRAPPDRRHHRRPDRRVARPRQRRLPRRRLRRARQRMAAAPLEAERVVAPLHEKGVPPRAERRLRRAPRRGRAALPRGADEDDRRERGIERVRRETEAGMERSLAKIVERLREVYGAPRADKILPFNGKQRTLAPDSNALRVLLRLGFGTESKNYAASYKSAVAAAGELPNAKEAHILLRRHGQEVCKNKAPRCEVCPLRGECAWYARHVR